MPITTVTSTRRISGHELPDSNHTVSTSASAAMDDPAGTRTGAAVCVRRRRAGNAAHVTAYAIRRVTVLIVNADKKVLSNVSVSATAAVTSVDTVGVR
jgi:hypothetical protein